MLKDAEPTDMGPVDIWAMTQKVEMPLYQMSSFGGKNIIEVDNVRGEWKWQTPISQDLPYIVENIEAAAQPGLDETTFRIKLNKREFGHGDIITYDKYNGCELIVSAEDDILPVGDGFIYTVRIVNNDSYKYLDPTKYLKPGTKFFRKLTYIILSLLVQTCRLKEV
jgi:hypothetical protein